MRHAVLVPFFAATALLASSIAHGQILIQHTGANDPLAEGFGFSVNSDGAMQVEPVFDDFGFEAWSLDKPSPGKAEYYYELQEGEAQAAAIGGWVMSANMRIVDMVEGGRATLGFQATQNFRLTLDLTDDDDIRITNSFGNLLYTVVGGGTDYHEYSVEYDPIEEMAAIWITGLGKVADFSAPLGSGEPTVSFGTPQGGGHFHWNDVTFAIVPEPETVALLAGMGALLVAGGIRWRDRKKPRQ